MNDTITSDGKFPVRTRNYVDDLDVELTRDQIVQNAQQAASLDGLIEQETEAMDNAKKLAKAKIESLESRKKLLLLEIALGHRKQSVACQERFNYRTAEVTEVRLDTEKVLSRRPMTEKERQPELPLGEGGTGGSADDTDEDPDTSVLDADPDPDSASLARDQADSAAGRDSDDIVVDDDHDPEKEPELPTRKKARGGKGSKGGKGGAK